MELSFKLYHAVGVTVALPTVDGGSTVYTLWDDIKIKNPSFTFVLFDKAGHNPMLEIPEEFNRTLIDWLKSH